MQRITQDSVREKSRKIPFTLSTRQYLSVLYSDMLSKADMVGEDIYDMIVKNLIEYLKLAPTNLHIDSWIWAA